MELNDIRAMTADQERGAWFELADPVTGQSTGIRLRIAGPDSETQNRARLKLADELAEIADFEGRVPAPQRESARQNSIAACVLDWECTEDGEAVPFSTANVLRLIKAATWVEAQIDAFASDRAAHRRDG